MSRPVKNATDPSEAAPEATPRGDETVKLLERAAKGDRSCLPEVRALLADGDRGVGLVDILGSPVTWLTDSLMKKSAGGNVAVMEAMVEKFIKVQTGLQGPDPSPLERLLAERAAVCWLQLYSYENHFARSTDLNIRYGEFHQRKIDAAHRRFLSAVRTLAQIRKLALPSLQVNIGQNQVNVS